MLNLSMKSNKQLYQFIVGIAASVFILAGCILILAPFIPAILLAIIFALATWPAFTWLNNKLHHKTTLSAFLMTVFLGVCFIIPLVIIGSSTADNFTSIYSGIENSLQGDTTQTTDFLEQIPYVGHRVAEYWVDLTSDKTKLGAAMQQYGGPTSAWLLKVGGDIGKGMIDLTLGVIIAYFFFRYGNRVAVRTSNLIETFGGERGRHLLTICKNTLIGVVYGMIGTAFAQGALAAVGFYIAQVPGAAFLGLLTFFVSFIPAGPPIVWLPVSLWLFSQGQSWQPIFLIIWGTILVGTIDNLLRPYFISRGSDLPFLLVLFGVIGGMMAFGFIGVFIGPTLLALAYTLILGWSTHTPIPKEKPATKSK